MQNTDDEEVRKKAKNPLTEYFGGQPKQPQAPQQPVTQAPPQGQNTQPQPAAAAPSTNVGGGAMANATQAAQLPMAAPAVQQAPTNFVNFKRYFNANKDIAEGRAQQMGGGVAGVAAGAAGQLGAVKDAFGNAVAAGTVTGPNGEPLTAAEMQARSEAGYTGPMGLNDAAGYAEAVKAAEQAQQQLGALGSTGGIQALLDRSHPEGSGTSKFSSMLAGAAGKQGFDALRARFNPNADLLKAGTEAEKQATTAKASSTANAAEWAKAAGLQLDKETAQAAHDQQVAKESADKQSAATKARLSQVPPVKMYAGSMLEGQADANNKYYGVDMNNAEEKAAREKEYALYEKAQHGDTKDDVNNAFEDMNSVMSPINWILNAGGWRDAGQDYFTQQYHANSGEASGGSKGRNINWSAVGPAGFWVWRNMTPGDWVTLNAKPRNGSNGQGAWIAQRLQDLSDMSKNRNVAAKGVARGP